MADNNRNLFSLDELSGYKVADGYPDVRGWEVIDAEGRNIGNVDRLLVSKECERVVYLDVEVNKDLIEEGHEAYAKPVTGVHEFINSDGENHVIVPIGVAAVDEENKKVCTNKINRETFGRTKRFKRDDDIDRSMEITVFRSYFPDSEFDNDQNSDSRFYDRDEFRRETK